MQELGFFTPSECRNFGALAVRYIFGKRGRYANLNLADRNLMAEFIHENHYIRRTKIYISSKKSPAKKAIQTNKHVSAIWPQPVVVYLPHMQPADRKSRDLQMLTSKKNASRKARLMDASRPLGAIPRKPKLTLGSPDRQQALPTSQNEKQLTVET